MPKIWIGRVDAPKKVLRGKPFTIKWRTWYIKWPWTKFTIFTKVVRFKETKFIDTLWFFGCYKMKYDDLIFQDTTYNLRSGYEE